MREGDMTQGLTQNLNQSNMRKLMALSTLCLMMTLVNGSNWTTVYYGVPVWKPATPPLFCASDPNYGSKEAGNNWLASSCLPTDPTPQSLYLNITEEFNAYQNYMVEEMVEDMKSLFSQALKPCVKLTPMCVRMLCVEVNTVSNASTTPAPSTPTPWGNWGGNGTGQPVYNCSFNQTTEFRDKKKQMYSLFWKEDIMKEEGSNGSHYYILNCNTSYITQACEKSNYEPVPLHYCAPPGYALLRCDDPAFTGQGSCSNVSAVTCTHAIQPIVATWFQLNSTGNAPNTTVMMNKQKNESIVVRLAKHLHVNITCIRPGNKTIRNLQIGAGMTFYSQLIVGGNTRKAYCKVNKTQWETALQAVHEAVKTEWEKKNNGTNVTTISWRFQPQGDKEVQTHWFNCQGEFFYCNVSALFINRRTNKTDGISPFDVNNKPNTTYHGGWLACTIRQMVTQWGYVSKSIYLPPRKGHVQCTSNITALLITGELYQNNVTLVPSAQVSDSWRSELSRYKVVEIDPLSMAPTTAQRRTGVHREKRAITLGMAFLGFLSTAGGTMGAAATALTVQSRSLLAGIVQQQENLLRAVTAQQSLLQLTVWGVKQLQARLTAVEKFIKDQTLLNAWGCANKAVCHTTVPWNNSWAKGHFPEWDNMTWQQWSELVDNDTMTIQQLLEAAQEQQGKNQHELMKPGQWDFLWNWFDISKWLWYIKIFIIVVAALIGLRILMFILGVISRLGQGYSLLSSQIPIPSHAGQPTPDGTGAGGGDGSNSRSPAYLKGFFTIIWEDLRNLVLWTYQILKDSVLVIYRILQRVSQRLPPLLHIRLLQLWESLRRLLAYCQYGIQELQAAVTSLLDALARFTIVWTDALLHAGGRLWRAIVAIPRRIRQGAEIFLN
ncbi:env protein [Simian immunodeficiency virus]|uniref:Envelope glycoprotein gp160 n=1 Tax=Simian immunodeficiency virus TaxID=11723 RepID=Q6VG34_SIV|nr:env protein [Simian immunodeficiency virus]